MPEKRKYSTWVLAFLFVVGIIIVYKTVDNFSFIFEFAGKVTGALRPFITGFIIAYLLNMPMKRINGLLLKSKYSFVTKRAKGLSILLTYILALILLTIFLRLIIPAIYQNIMDIYYSVPYYINLIMQKLTALQEQLGINFMNIDKASAVEAVQGFISNMKFSEFSKYAQGVIDVTSGIISVFIAIIVSIYMLMDKAIISSAIKRFLHAFIKKEYVDRFLDFSARINEIFTRYIFSVVLDCVIVGILCTVAMSILNVRYSIVLGVMIGIFSLIPYFGAIVAVTLSIIITLLTGGWIKALWTGILLLVLQQIDGNFIGPRIMGNMLKARPLLIIFAVTLGGGLFGVWGMILSVPIAMVVKLIIDELLTAREAKNEQENR